MKTLSLISLIALLLIAAYPSFAQPQAPIEWGEARLLTNGPSDINLWNGVFAHGDTLVVAGDMSYGVGTLAMASVSGDNGQTWSPWHTFLTDDSADWVLTFAVTSGGLMCAGPVHNFSRGIYRSTDLGQTWISPTIRIPYLELKCVRGDTIWCSSWGWEGDSVRWTADGGLHYSSAIGVNLNFEGIDDIAISDSVVIITSRTDFPEYPYLTSWFLTAPRPNGPFTARQRLNTFCRETYSTDVELDPNGTGMILSCARYSTFFPGGGAEFLTITRDHGQTWSEPDTFRALESGGRPFIRHAGSEWIAMWWDSCVSAPFSYYGLWYRFSANQGRSWYPIQQAFGENIASGWIGPIELTEDRVRMYGSVNLWNGITGRYYLQWEGQIHRDTLAPEIATAFIIPPTLPADTTVTFSTIATDNDSLWQIDVIIRYLDQSDSLILPLTRGDDDNFAAFWLVPNDSGVYRYAYRAEDMWEHVTSYPDTGWLSFAVEPSSVSENSILPSSSFILSVYPNPFNNSTQIAFMLPTAQKVTLRLYDILGCEVMQLMDKTQPAGKHNVQFDGGALSSGTYFCRMQAGGFEQTKKMVVVR